MPIFNTNSIGPAKYEPEIKRRVFFTGDTALKRGEAVVWDLIPPTTAEAGVGQAVKAVSSSYKMPFAGVVAEDKDAKTAASGLTSTFLAPSAIALSVAPSPLACPS